MRIYQIVVVCAALGLDLPGALANSVYIAEKCQGGVCPNPKFPILDFDKEQGTCICRAHPCWNNDGVEHKCLDPEFPHLRFHYNRTGSLQCGCGKQAVMESVHVARNMCAGESCPSDAHPILDWDPEGQKCICRANPCAIDTGGVHHMCKDAQYPLLHYTFEPGAAAPKCDCHTRLAKPAAALRGARAQRDEPSEEACTWTARRSATY